ncbi:ATP-binding protein [Siminovitchia thermophila]|nr:ATP-binding protein [Siminovitchia thermophila]
MADLKKKAEEKLANSTNQENGQTRTSQPKDSFECPKCEDRGLIFTSNDSARICECQEQRKIKRLFKSSEITEEFRRLGFGNFIVDGKPEPVVNAFKSAVKYFKSFPDIRKDRKNSIALLGNPGAGKTHLLIAVANNLLNNGISVHYFPYREGFDEIKDNLDALEEKAQRMKDVDVLLIDDLFKRGATDFEVKTMYSIVNYRYLNHKPIMVSSEFLVDDLLEVDEALGSRIVEMTKDYLVEIVGDRRQLNHRLAN